MARVDSSMPGYPESLATLLPAVVSQQQRLR